MAIEILFRRRLSVENLRFFLALLCISSYAFLEQVSVSIPAFSPIKYILLYVAGISIFFEMPLILRNILKKKYFYAAGLLMVMIGLLLLSAYMNRKPVVGSSPVYGTARLILYLIELFALVLWVAESGRVQYVLRFLLRYLLILLIVTDVLLLTEWATFTAGNYAGYLLGNKFSVAYRHIELLALWMICDRERFWNLRSRKPRMFLMTIFIAAIAYLVDCMTGILGVIVFVLLYSFVEQRQNRIQRLSNPLTLTLSLLCSLLLPFVVNVIVNNPIMKFIIEDLFQRDTTLTGRVFIFNMFGEKLSGRWLFGFGFGNGNAAAMRLFKYANAQNALLQWILQTGIGVTMVLCFWMCRIFSQLYNSKECSQIAPIIVLIYTFVALGTIETTFSMAFIFWCALIWMYIAENKAEV